MGAEIQIKRSTTNPKTGDTFDITRCDVVLKEGELFYDLTSNLFYVGNGTNTLAELFSAGKFMSAFSNEYQPYNSVGGVTFTLIDGYGAFENYATVSGYSGSSTYVFIPAYVSQGSNIFKVKAIDAGAFSRNTSIVSIHIPDTIEEIKDGYPETNGAFYDCTNLEAINGSKSLHKIGNYAFYNCSKLTGNSADFLFGGVVNKGQNIFDYPSPLKIIGNYAFYGCQSIDTVTVRSGGVTLNYILEIPSSVASIGNHAFDGCTSIHNLIIKNTEDNISFGTD